MAILSTNQRLINVGDSYSAGNGIDITNNIISVTGDNAPYSAGDNIDIQDHIISGKDWSNDIEQASANAYNVTTAWVQDNYANSADMSYISAMVDTKLDTSAWSSVSGDLATESYVIMADNITYDRAKGYVDSKGYATEEFVKENTSGKLESTAFDTWQQGQYTNDIAGLNNLIGTKLDASSFEETSGTFYPTSNPSGFITGVDLTPYYTTAEANTLSSMLSGAIDFVSANADDPEVTNLVQTNSGVWNEVTNKLDSSSFSDVSGTFYTYDNPSGFITGVDLSNYYTKDETSGKEELANAFANIPVGDPEVNAYVTSHSASTDESTNLVQSNSSTWNDVTVYQSNSANYLTSHQDISYKLDTSSFTAWSAAQADNNYQLSAGDGISIIDDDVNKITRIDVTAGGETGGDMFSAYLEYNDQNQISGYAGSAFAGQGGAGNPEVESYVQTNSANIDDTVTSYQTNSGDYLKESELGYNAVDEVSAINGSAIAQYGAEKQWLVHDDTLVHASNSAQYALGVNLSAVAQLLGVDETVLWSGARQTTGTIQLSESMWNYNTMDIYVCPDYNTYSARMGYQITRLTVIPQIDNNEQLLCYAKSNRIASNTYLSELFYLRFNPDGSSVDFSPGIKWSNNTVTTGVTAFTGAVTKIVGIGRKS